MISGSNSTVCPEIFEYTIALPIQLQTKEPFYVECRRRLIYYYRVPFFFFRGKQHVACHMMHDACRIHAIVVLFGIGTEHSRIQEFKRLQSALLSYPQHFVCLLKQLPSQESWIVLSFFHRLLTQWERCFSISI